jgi:lipopolysaccharide/colanic/teichoic acid biosynthesis glycosyltransferase
VRTTSHDPSGVGSPAAAGRTGLLWGGWLREWSALWSRRHVAGTEGNTTGQSPASAGQSPASAEQFPAHGIGPARGTGPTRNPGLTRGTGPTRNPGLTRGTGPACGTGPTRGTGPACPDVATTFPRTLRSASSRSGWALVGGPGSLSLTLLTSELVVLLAYLATTAVIESDPFTHVMINGNHWGLRGWLVVLWALTVVLFGTGGAYRQRLTLSVWAELPALGWRAVACLVGVVVLVDHADPATTRDAVAVLGAAGMGSHLVVRLGVCALLREARQSLRTVSRTLVLGGGTLSFKTVELLDTHHELGLLVLGYLDDAPAPLSHGPAGWTYLGQVEDLPHVVQRLQIQTVIIGFGSGSDALAAQALRRLTGGPGQAPAPVQVFAVPRLFELGRHPLSQDHAGPIPLTRVRSASRRGPRWAVKRALDVATAVGGLVLTAPLLAGLALAVRVECGPGPVVVGQEHVGRRGAGVRLWRFRSARPGRGPGPVGRRLRGSWLGGLPVLWNLLTGDVSVVGPRPMLPQTSQRLQRMLPHYEHRLQVRGGLVSPGAASACEGDPPADEAVLYDTAYVENWGLWTDATVLVHGLRRVLRKGVRVVRTW